MGKQEFGRWDAAWVLCRYQISFKPNWVFWRRAPDRSLKEQSAATHGGDRDGGPVSY